MDDVTLYGYPTSPFVMKVGCYLKFKRLPFRYVPVNPIHNREIRFTGQRQVPVLKIGEEWRKDSTPLGIWLDERFPERGLLGATQAESQDILAMDRWISDQLIPARFRAAVEWESWPASIANGWRLARAVHDATPLPFVARVGWPFLVRRAKFITRMMAELDLSEPLPAMRQRLLREFLDHLGAGPFLGGRQVASLADLSAYPTLVSGYLMGMQGDQTFLENPDVAAWCARVQAELPANPLLVPDRLLKREMRRAPPSGAVTQSG